MGNLLAAGIGLFLVSAVIVVLLLVPFIMFGGHLQLARTL